MLSERENLVRTMRGEVPEYIPIYSIMYGTFFKPSCYIEGRGPDNSGIDLFGVEWINEGSAIQGAIPRSDIFILDDIRKWRDVIVTPDFTGLDWEAMAKKDKENWDPSRPFGGGTASCAQGFFQAMISFMGFTEGLTACHTEPDEVKALMEYMCDWAVTNAKLFIKYYEPDFGSYPDDIAHERMPFVSAEMFRDLFAPTWKRYIDVFQEAGLPVEHHDCGFCEPLLDDFVAVGINAWDPIQNSNDVFAIKEKFGSKLGLCTGMRYPQEWYGNEASEEEVRAHVKYTLDRLAPGGGLLMSIPPAPPPGVEIPQTPMAKYGAWVRDEFEKLKFSYYN
ncbi:MAG: veratrol--corrinoid protein metyltransferase [Oscillospiraceae bacterium]|nr:veratrol--corrinoid protein metyltransferase [Oscillospiraceae bacterium]